MVDRTVYLSGCLGLDKDTGKLVTGGAAAEMKKALENLGAILNAADSKYENVIKATIFVKDLGDFASVNEEYKKGKSLKFTLKQIYNIMFLFSFHKGFPSQIMLSSSQITIRCIS